MNIYFLINDLLYYVIHSVPSACYIIFNVLFVFIASLLSRNTNVFR
jgi:hypothetical protein